MVIAMQSAALHSARVKFIFGAPDTRNQPLIDFPLSFLGETSVLTC